METLKKKGNVLLLDDYTAKARDGFEVGKSRGSTHVLAMNAVAFIEEMFLGQ